MVIDELLQSVAGNAAQAQQSALRNRAQCRVCRPYTNSPKMPLILPFLTNRDLACMGI